MLAKVDSNHALFALVDEVSRLNGRFKSAFAGARKTVELGESEMTVLNSVVEAERSPTVAQIGRSLGIARQLIQRAANSLIDQGLVEAIPNPDHKRAPLLLPTAKGLSAKAVADEEGLQIVARIEQGLELETVRITADSLRDIRKILETHIREGKLS